MKLSSFSTYWAFYVYSYLSRFGMPYFWPIFFHNYSYSNFDVFWNMKLSSFSTQSGISCLLIFEWIRNALLFFGPSFFHTYSCSNCVVNQKVKLSSFSSFGEQITDCLFPKFQKVRASKMFLFETRKNQ